MKRELFTGILTLLILQCMLGCSKEPLEILNGKWQAQDVPYSLELAFDIKHQTIEQLHNGDQSLFAFEIINVNNNIIYLRIKHDGIPKGKISIEVLDNNTIKTTQHSGELTFNRMN